MYNTLWIERPVDSRVEPSPEEAALKESYLAACKLAYQLVCASNQLCGVQNPDVTACAAIIREAVHQPEKQRASAVKAAELAVLHRQAEYVSTRTYFLQYAEAWKALRPTLVAQLEAVAVPKEEPAQSGQHHLSYIDIHLCLNCEAVADLIEGCDIAINEANRRHYSRPTDKHAETGFQKVFDALVAEVTGHNWVANARLSCRCRHSYDILRDVAVDKVSSTHMPAQYTACNALDAARDEFEEAASWSNNQKVRDFNQETRGTFNETQMAESLLGATGDLTRMLYLEGQRDAKLCAFFRSWRGIRHQVETTFALFARVAELLPAACAEAAAIEDETLRRRAQNLCLFAARRLKENVKFMRENDRFADDRDSNFQDTSAAVSRRHQALVARIKSGEIRRPSTKVREEPYYG